MWKKETTHYTKLAGTDNRAEGAKALFGAPAAAKTLKTPPPNAVTGGPRRAPVATLQQSKTNLPSKVLPKHASLEVMERMRSPWWYTLSTLKAALSCAAVLALK